MFNIRPELFLSLVRNSVSAGVVEGLEIAAKTSREATNNKTTLNEATISDILTNEILKNLNYVLPLDYGITADVKEEEREQS